MHQRTNDPNKNAQRFALQSFRGALDLLCNAVKAQGILPGEIAEILAQQAALTAEDDNPTVAQILENACDFLPVPRDL